MPGTFEAALVFAYAIVPGFLTLIGYQSGRSQKRATPERDLHVIAEAFVLSLGWIILPPIALAAIELASWVSGDPIDSSLGRVLAAFALAAVVFFLPLAVGYGAGRFERAAREGNGGRAGEWFRRLVPQRMTAWDTIWMPVLTAANGRALVPGLPREHPPAGASRREHDDRGRARHARRRSEDQIHHRRAGERITS